MAGKTILAFLLGTAAGVAGTYVCLREATERYISNEIQAFKEEWAETHKTPENGVYEATEASQEGSKDEYMQRKLEAERAGGHTALRGEQDY